MAMITAEQQRTIATATPTEDELESKYGTAVELVKRESSLNRRTSIAVSIAEEDLTEFTDFFESKGFKVLPIAGQPETTPTPVRAGSDGELSYWLIVWSSVTIATPISPMTKGQQQNWDLSCLGIASTVLYWRDTGTAAIGSFSDTKTGSVTVNAVGQGLIARQLQLTAVSSATAVVNVYLDPAGQQLLATAAAVVIA